MSGYFVKIIAFSVIVAAVAVAVVSLPSEESEAATSGTCGDGVAWSFDLDSRTLSLTYTGTGTGKMDDHDSPLDFGYTSHWKNIDHVVIGEGVTSIGASAFQNFTVLTFEFPDSLEEIGHFALEGNKITSIDLKNVVKLDDGAFYYCKELTSVVIPPTVVSIGNYAFDLCESLMHADLTGATSLVSIGNSSFVSTPISSFYVPATVTSLGTGMFAECYYLGTIEVDPSNTHYVVQDGAVYNSDMPTVVCYPPKKAASVLEIPDTVTSIGKAAFVTAQYINAVTIPDSVTVIGDNAFEKCVSLTTIKIPATVTHIGQFAFNDCIGLQSIDFSGTTALKSMGQGAFLSCSSLTSVDIPACVESMGVRVFGQCGALESIYIDPSNPYYVTVDGILYDKSMETIMQYPGGYPATDFTIPDGVKKIELNAFSAILKLESVTIPDSVTTIEDGAFTCPSYVIKLTKITFGDGLTTITGEHPFIANHYLDKDGKELAQTPANLRGHTFEGESSSHMYIVDDDPSDDGGNNREIIGAAIVVVLIAVIGALYVIRPR